MLGVGRKPLYNRRKIAYVSHSSIKTAIEVLKGKISLNQGIEAEKKDKKPKRL